MSESETPVLSQYFSDSENKAIVDQEGNQVANNINSKEEPNVCRLFSKTPSVLKDPTAAFFDSIGTSASANTGIINDLGLSNAIEDNYNARLASGSEIDRRRDAWIPTERTRQCLIAYATAAAGTYFPERDQLTMPGVILEEELGDCVGDAVSMCLGEAEASQRRILTANDVTQDERGLRELVQAGSYRAAINLTARLLNIYGQGKGRSGFASKHSPRSLQLWFTRIALLIKIKSYSIAETEAEQFGELDKPDLFYQFYPEMYGGRSGSIASFSFRLLLGELPMHCSKTKESLTKLFNLLATVKQILKNLRGELCEDGTPAEISAADRADSIKLWSCRESRIMHSIINCALVQKDYELATNLLEQLCDRDETPQDSLLSALGRLYLQMGDVSAAEMCFNKARSLRNTPENFRELVDRGLIAVAQNAFTEAYLFFEKASELQPNNVMVLNNMGVCLLYSGQLKEAIGVLESGITLNPVQGLHESLVLNLCTLYDMESSKGRLKKFALLRQISRYHADAPTTILEKLYG